MPSRASCVAMSRGVPSVRADCQALGPAFQESWKSAADWEEEEEKRGKREGGGRRGPALGPSGRSWQLTAGTGGLQCTDTG